MNTDMDRTWQSLSEEVLTGMKDWRLAHPKATFREIEQAVDERVNRLKARMLADAALASDTRDWREAPQTNGQRVRPVTPHWCVEGNSSDDCTSPEDRMSPSRAPMARAPSVERGFSPLDEELALVPGSLAPGVQEHLAHLATWMPFRRAAQMLSRLLGVQVSEATIRRQTEAVGAIAEALHTAKSQQPDDAVPSSPPAGGAPRLVFSADGAYVGLLHGVWAEVRTLVIAEVGPNGKAHTLSYFSRKTEAQRFAELAEGETRRRGLVQAQQVGAVTDGADWLQGLIDLHRPDAVRILDFAHAAQRFGLIAQAYEAAGQPLPQEWVATQCHTLKHHGPAQVLEQLQALSPVETAQEHVHYLEKRDALMQYPSFQADGWPIGSGMVESGNKVVMQARLKGAGMRWEGSHVNPMLELRTSAWNDRWDEMWEDVGHERQQQRRQRRVQRASPRLAAMLGVVLLAWQRAQTPLPITPPPCLVRPSQPAATLPGSSRPSAHHPWKRGPVCRPKLSAKN